MRRTLPLLALLLLAALGLAACGSAGSSASRTRGGARAASTAPKTLTASTATNGCKQVPAPPPKGSPNLPRPTGALDPHKTYTAVVQTNCGSFTIALDVKQDPKTTASFAYLVRRGFYDGLTFHRVVPGFVIQGGDPAGDGTGGPGYQVVEAPPKGTRYTRGVVAVAKTQVDPAGASGSQFFVVTAQDAQLPPDYAVLGKVSSGQSVVDRIGTLPTDQQQRPTIPVVIEKITLQAS